MTISECIENLDNVSDDIETLTQIPHNDMNYILDKIDEVCCLLEDVKNDYGDDPSDETEDDE